MLKWRHRRRGLALALFMLGCSSGTAQQAPATPKTLSTVTKPADSPEVVQLKALVFRLQSALIETERQLGVEKTRRAELEMAAMTEAAKGLTPAVRQAIGLDRTTTAPQTPPKE